MKMGGTSMDDREWLSITAQDRCDKCGAQAYVVTRIYGTDMLWCAHDYRAGETKLVAVATRIWDYRFLLDEEAKPGRVEPDD